MRGQLDAMKNSTRRKAGSPGLVDAVRNAGVRDPRVLEAFRRVSRLRFVPSAHATRADHDEPIPIGHGQVTTQPSLIGHMVEALQLTGRERVLEIGTGFGYQTAILATLAKHVYSIEILPDLAERARDNLARAGIHNAVVVAGDGCHGLPAYAPYQAIIVAAAAPSVPPALIDQLDSNGRLVQPIGPGGNQVVVVFRKQDGHLTHERTVTAACFVPLVGESATGGPPERPRAAAAPAEDTKNT